ncbi:MAG: glycosyltransferase [Acidobacteria bacterium]|nr:glycosyltransferase [Acidobacteriota bacterium]
MASRKTAPASPMPRPQGLRVEPLYPERLLQAIEAALRSGDLEGARQATGRGRMHFPTHPKLLELETMLRAGKPREVLAQAGWERPWHLAKIPRKAHFYWGNERTSFLRYLSIASFRLFNPDWEVNLYVPSAVHQGEAAWVAGEAYEGTSYHGRDYSALLYQLPGIRVREVDFSAFPEIEGAPETYKSDFFRWHILTREGGAYCDTDILFCKPLRAAPVNVAKHRDLEAGVCIHEGHHIIGFYFSAPGAPLFEAVKEKAIAALDMSDYQSIGSHLLNRLYPDVAAIRKAHPAMPVHNLPMELVYPFDWREIHKIHEPGDPASLPEGCIGIHWYAGSSLTQKYNNLIDHATCGTVGTILDRLAKSLLPRLETSARGAVGNGKEPGQGPKFTVLVPTYNQAHFLPATLDSLRAQTYENWEAVVVNDGSTDGTREVLEGYAARDPRIRAFHQANGGVGSALNAALAQATGDWVCWLSSDDLFEPDALETFASAIAELPKARFFYSNFSQLFEETGEKRPMPERRQVSLPTFEVQTLALLEANYINGITICIQRSLLQASGGWKPELKYAQDLDLWLRLSVQTRLHYLDHRTAVTRVHGAQGTQTFPMAGFFDSARAGHEFLNTHRFEELFPWADLRFQPEIISTINSVFQVASNLNAFLYHGVGPNTALLDRLLEWVESQCPEEYRKPVVDGVKRSFTQVSDVPGFLKEWGARLGTGAQTPFIPQDPLLRMEEVLRRLEAGGETRISGELRRYLVNVVGRTLEAARPVEGPAASPKPAISAARTPVRIVLIRPEGYAHSEAFREVAQSLESALKSLGVPTDLAENELKAGALNVLLGWHLMDEQGLAKLPKGTVLYNLEQMDERNRELRERLVRRSATLEIWDYSARNLEILAKAGMQGEPRLLPIGYDPVLTRIPEAQEQDIDVLFYGSTNPRRIQILEALQAAGLKVHRAFNVYGAERDALIARSKVVLNLHFFDSSIFELVRVSYLLANRKAVVAECHAATEVEPSLREGLILATYDGLVEACRSAVGDPERRHRVGERGFQLMADRALTGLLRPVLPAEVLPPRPAPAVSVIMPTKDRPEFLARALDSLAPQTFRSFEVVVVNDGGGDPAAVVAAARAKGLEITLLQHPRPRGQAGSRNTGIRAARGRWIAYLDDDDLYYPDHLQVLTEALERTGAQVAYTDSMRAVEELRKGEWVVLSRELAMSNAFDREHFLRDNLTPVNNVMHARACWEAVGPHDESLPVLEDWEYWIRLSRRWDFLHIPKATAEVRWRSSGANITFERRDLFPECRQRIAAKVADLLAAEAAPRPGLREMFLHEPVWTGAAWVEVLLAYLEAFAPGDPVCLALALDPKAAGGLSVEEAQARVLEVVERTGREAFPDVALVDRAEDWVELLRPCTTLQWIPGSRAAWNLVGPNGQRLMDARSRLGGWTEVPPPASPEPSWGQPMAAVAAPNVSVIVPTYRRPEALARALESIRQQTLPPLEVIVVDDGGGQAEPVVAAAALAGLPVHLIELEHPRGQGAARNRGLAQARGRWIAYLDDDDLWRPDHLARLTVALSGSGHRVGYADTALQVGSDPIPEPVETPPLSALIHHRELGERFDEELPLLEDRAFVARLAARGPILHVPGVTVDLFRGPSCASVRRAGLRAWCQARLEALPGSGPELAQSGTTSMGRP